MKAAGFSDDDETLLRFDSTPLSEAEIKINRVIPHSVHTLDKRRLSPPSCHVTTGFRGQQVGGGILMFSHFRHDE